MSHRPIATLVLAGAFFLSGCHATGPHADVSGTVSVEGDSTRVEVSFGERERQRIREYYGSRRGLPPGLAKKEELPPGLARQVRRDGELPPGLEGKRLPRELERDLPRPPEGYVRLRVGLDVVLVDRDTRVVVDIIEDIGPE